MVARLATCVQQLWNFLLSATNAQTIELRVLADGTVFAPPRSSFIAHLLNSLQIEFETRPTSIWSYVDHEG